MPEIIDLFCELLDLLLGLVALALQFLLKPVILTGKHHDLILELLDLLLILISLLLKTLKLSLKLNILGFQSLLNKVRKANKTKSYKGAQVLLLLSLEHLLKFRDLGGEHHVLLLVLVDAVCKPMDLFIQLTDLCIVIALQVREGFLRLLELTLEVINLGLQRFLRSIRKSLAIRISYLQVLNLLSELVLQVLDLLSVPFSH